MFDIMRRPICYDRAMVRSKYTPFHASDEREWVAAIEAAVCVAEEGGWEGDGGRLFRPHCDSDVIVRANDLPPFAVYARQDILSFALAFEFARAIEAAVRLWDDGLGKDAAYELRHALKVVCCLQHRYEELERGRIVLRAPTDYHHLRLSRAQSP